MKTTALAITFLLATLHFQIFSCSVSNESNESEEEQDEFIASPIDLNDENFEEVIKTNNHLVMFYSSEVPERLNYTLYLLAELFNNENGSKLKIAQFECATNSQTCLNNGIINKSPVLKLFKINQAGAVKYRNSKTHLHYVLQFLNEQLDLPATENSGSSGKAVVELTAENFRNLTANGNWLIDFYFPWCIHAKNLDPVWEKLASKLDQNQPVNIGKIDCVKYESAVCDDFGIRGSPTILWLENGQNVDNFDKNPTVKFLKSYIESKLES